MPLHQRKKLVSCHLDKKLRDEFGIRALPVRRDDIVKVMRGSFKGKRGKVTKVDLKKGVVFIENVNRKKVDGTEVPVPFKPSNLMIVSLDRTDERRFKHLKKRIKTPSTEKKTEKISKEEEGGK